MNCIRLGQNPNLIRLQEYQYTSIQNEIDTDRGQPKWLPSPINC